MTIYIYAILFILSMLSLVLLIALFRKRVSIYHVFMYCCCTLTNLGYMQIKAAEGLEAALFANQVVYIGAVFSPVFFMLSVSELVKVKVPKFVSVFFTFLALFIIGCVSLDGVFNLYYTKVELFHDEGFAYLVKEYGPLHTLFPLHLILCFLISLFLIIVSIRKRKEVSLFTSFSLLLYLFVTILVYAIETILGIKLEILPFAYVFVQFNLLGLLHKISLYDVSTIARSSLENSKNYGFVICDSRGKLLGSGDVAQVWFPELKTLRVDSKMPEGVSDFVDQIINWTRNIDRDKVVYFERADKIIEVKYGFMRESRHTTIHCVQLRDDTQQQRYLQLTRQYNENLERDVASKTEKIRKIQNDITISMASIVEDRDSNTGGHIIRTSDVVKIFVNHLMKNNTVEMLDNETAERIIKAAPLHDFGKIGVPDVVLNKPGKFTDEEYEIMKTHSAKGAVIVAKILKNSEDELFKKIAVNVAHYHHEKWNGQGYPEKISGMDIPFEARVMALADVFDALVSKRVYKDSFDYERAFSIIEESCGTHFDPVLCKAFLECREELIALYDSYSA